MDSYLLLDTKVFNPAFVILGAFDDTILDRQEVDWNRYNLAKQAFVTCNSDGEEGLTWDEISTCEVKPMLA